MQSKTYPFFVILLILLLKFTFASVQEINWRYYSANHDDSKIEVDNWFQLEYGDKGEWASENLSWHFQNNWCEVLSSSQALTSARCNLHGQYAFGIQKGATTLEVRNLLVHYSHVLYNWGAKSNVVRTASELSVQLVIWVTGNEAQTQLKSQDEFTNRLTEVFKSNGESPIVEMQNVSKSAQKSLIQNAIYKSNTSSWVMFFTVPSHIRCLHVKIKSSTTFSLLDKFIRDTTHVIEAGYVSAGSLEKSLTAENKLKSSFSKLVKDPCAPQKAALISPSGVYLTMNFWKSNTVTITSEEFMVFNVEDLVYTGPYMLLLIAGTVTIVPEGFEPVVVDNGLPYQVISSIITPDVCHEIDKWRNIVVAMSASNIANSASWLFISFNNGVNFASVGSPEWNSLLQISSVVQGWEVLGAKIHSVFTIVRFLVTVKFSSLNATVLIDYHFNETKWKIASFINLDGVRNFHFLISTSVINVLWSDTILTKQQGNAAVILKDFTSYGSKIKHVLTDHNGRLIVELQSNRLFTWHISVHEEFLEISPWVIAGSTGLLNFDTVGRLKVTEFFINGAELTASEYFYPLYAEIDTATNARRCKVASFTHTGKQGWNELDIGQTLTISVVMVSLDSGPTIEYITPALEGLDGEIFENTRMLGKYTEKTLTIQISISNQNSSRPRPKDIFTALVFYPLNIAMECTKFSPQSVFLYLGCLKTSKLVVHPNLADMTAQAISGSALSEITYLFNAIKGGSIQLQLTVITGNVLLAPPALLFRETQGREDFSVVQPTFYERRELHTLFYVTYQVTFHESGKFHFHLESNSKFSICKHEVNMQVLVKAQVEISNSIYVITSVGLGISFAFVMLAISFFFYRRKTIREHEMEAENIRRQQELRYLTNLQDYRDNMTTVIGGGRRKSSALKEGLRKRNLSLSAISEAE